MRGDQDVHASDLLPACRWTRRALRTEARRPGRSQQGSSRSYLTGCLPTRIEQCILKIYFNFIATSPKQAILLLAPEVFIDNIPLCNLLKIKTCLTRIVEVLKLVALSNWSIFRTRI